MTPIEDAPGPYSSAGKSCSKRASRVAASARLSAVKAYSGGKDSAGHWVTWRFDVIGNPQGLGKRL